MPTPIYHITHIDNLTSILNSGGLIANSRLWRQRINYLDIAYERIQDRRARTSTNRGSSALVHQWSDSPNGDSFASRKRKLFKPKHIRKAWQRLHEQNWLALSASW